MVEVGAEPGRFSSLHLVHESAQGFCRLFSAVSFGRKVILKALKVEFIDSAPHRELLYKEYCIGHELQHPHIAATYSYARNVESIGPAIVMEYVSGLTLKEWIQSHPAPSLRITLPLIRQICDALTYIHQRQIVHRDLKPSNIMLTQTGGYIKIIDFGLSDGTNYVHYKYPGGTHRYGAPEQFAAGAEVDSRADIYALGVILEEIGGASAIIKTGHQCRAERPENRPATASEVIRLIHRHRRNRGLRIASFAAIFCVTAAVGSIWLMRTRNDAPPSPISTSVVPAADSISVASAPLPAAQLQASALDDEAEAQPQSIQAKTATNTAPMQTPPTPRSREADAATASEAAPDDAEHTDFPLSKGFNAVNYIRPDGSVGFRLEHNTRPDSVQH